MATTLEQKKAQNKRKKIERDNKKKRGLIQVNVWIKPKHRAVLKSIVEKLKNEKETT